LRTSVIALAAFALTGCRQDMHDQPRLKPLQPTALWSDGRGSRPLVEGTVARGQLRLDRELYAGRKRGAVQQVQVPVPQGGGGAAPAIDPSYVTEFPFPITRQVLERGRDRYNIFCTPCHAYTGSGRGMIVQRGLTPPPAFGIERLRQAPVGHFFDVITNGYGAMYSYASRIPVDDRWAIVAYVRVLQYSQSVPVNDQGAAPQQPLPNRPSGEIGTEQPPANVQRPREAAPGGKQ
jgi:hypothetical protein